MKQDEIIEMARQAGIPFNKWGMIGCENCEQDIDQNLVAFAKLVADKERDACAKTCDELVIEFVGNSALTADQCARTIRARGEA